jgi:hypothetical protein
MINLIITLCLVCTTLGATLSNTTKYYGARKQREHKGTLKLD